MKRFGICVAIALTCAQVSLGQTSTKAGAGAARAPRPARDFSSEPFVIEHYVTSIRFENNGTAARELKAQFRLQSDAGAQQLKDLFFTYDAAIENVDVPSAEILKANGTTIKIPKEAITDAPLALTTNNPAYSAEKQKHIVFADVVAGDTLSYDIVTHPIAPVAAGQFWFQQDFIDDAIVLDEQVKIDVPDGRTLFVKSPSRPPTITRANARAIYAWKSANLTRPANDDPATAARKSAAHSPDILLTTFASWQDVAKWYAGLSQKATEPSK